MQQRLKKAERYRKEANRFADLAKQTIEPGFLVELYRRTAVRYVLMAEDLERWPDQPKGRKHDAFSLNVLADAFVS
jgi:hypothetical protein